LSPRIASVEPLGGFVLRLAFEDGTTRDVDLDADLWGPVFEPLRADAELFRQVRIDVELGTIVWGNGADMDPDVLHGDASAPARTIIEANEAELLFDDEHVRRYRETNGEVGHIWRLGTTILLLTTTGRKTGEPRTVPLIYTPDAGGYAIIASRGGAPKHPGWYVNLRANPVVSVQVRDEVFQARARTVEGEERARLWKLAAQQWPEYDEYVTRTEREIPVVMLERSS
jgi:deazaflavin-dependent oxidoreductase (nitroreductase family)